MNPDLALHTKQARIHVLTISSNIQFSSTIIELGKELMREMPAYKESYRVARDTKYRPGQEPSTTTDRKLQSVSY